MTRFERNSRSFIEKVIDESIEQPKIGTVDRVYEHGAPKDDSNFEVDVSIDGGTAVERRVPIATGGSGEVKVPRAGDTVLLQYTGSESNLPVVTKTVWTNEDRAPPGPAGMHRKSFEGGYSPTRGGNIYVTGYTEYDEQPADTYKSSLLPKETIFQIAKHQRNNNINPIERGGVLKFEMYDSPVGAKDESHIVIEGNAVDQDPSKSISAKMDLKRGTLTVTGENSGDEYTIEMDVENETLTIKGDSDSNNKMGASFNFNTDEFSICDGNKFGISSDGSGNFTWSHKSINMKEESGDTGSISL